MNCDLDNCLFRPSPKRPDRIFCTKCGQHFKTSQDRLTEEALFTFCVILLAIGFTFGGLYFLWQKYKPPVVTTNVLNQPSAKSYIVKSPFD